MQNDNDIVNGDVTDDAFEIVDRNGDTVAVTSVDALDEEFGPDQTFAERLTDLTDDDLGLAVAELVRRAMNTVKRHVEVLDVDPTVYVIIAASGNTDDGVPIISHEIECYHHSFVSNSSSKVKANNLVTAAVISAQRVLENNRIAPRKMLTAY